MKLNRKSYGFLVRSLQQTFDLGGNMNKLHFRPIFSAHKLAFVIAAIILAVATSAAAMFFTPGQGVITASVKARAGFVDPTDIKIKVNDGSQHVFHMPNAADTVVQEIAIAPGGHTGWHSHPGPVVVLIKSGTMSFYDADDPTCSVRSYTAGQAFVDSGQGHVHIARNESATENLELWAVYFDVPVGGAFRNDVTPAPGNCAF